MYQIQNKQIPKYVPVPVSVWKKLTSIYGGGPTAESTVVPVTLFRHNVCLFPTTIHTATVKNYNLEYFLQFDFEPQTTIRSVGQTICN